MRPSRLILPLTVFVVGAASLGAEIAATRLLAPWFGASTIVWANTIATVLVALSVGYAVGGRIADRHPHLGGLSRVVLLAAVLLAGVPFAAGPFLRSSVVAFDHISAGLFVGSLVSVGLLIAVPVLLLGMVSPYAVKLAVQHLEDTGRTAGRLYALGTVGSLVGTFLAALVLIPVVGTRRTFLLFALSLALTSILGLGRLRLWQGAAVLVSVGVVALMALPVGVTKPETADGRVIWEKETPYQYARVIQESDGERLLELNEGQAVHSVYRPRTMTYLTGRYWDQMLIAPSAGERTPRRVAILGSAAGTTASALTHYFPHVQVDAVEIDPDVIAVGKRLFGLHSGRIHLHQADARPWLQAQQGTYDAILVDAYRQPYIPFYLTTEEFFDEVRSHLTPGGVMAVNIGHPEGSPELEKVLTATSAAVFGRSHVYRDVVSSTNVVMLATHGQGDPRERLRDVVGPPDVTALGQQAADRLAPGLRGGTVYTDDRAPVEWLVDSSLAQVATHDGS